MPAKNQLDPTSLRTRTRAWLATHPGWHPSRTVVTGVLGDAADPADRTALIRELNRMVTRREGVTSYRPPDAPSRGPGTLYAPAGTTPPA